MLGVDILGVQSNLKPNRKQAVVKLLSDNVEQLNLVPNYCLDRDSNYDTIGAAFENLQQQKKGIKKARKADPLLSLYRYYPGNHQAFLPTSSIPDGMLC